mmetsp:Transcript_18615/g.74326  ORF Transcript_18615/g.74326 Transcript_18615/m.74326 type:complete len:200 (+) Transcript_18615:164-763(+)
MSTPGSSLLPPRRRVDERLVGGEPHLVAHVGREARRIRYRVPIQRRLLHRRIREAFLDDGARDAERDVADPLDVGEGAALVDLLRRHRRGARLGRLEEHAVGDLRGARDGRGEADAGEDVHVVALRGHVELVVVLDRSERRARRDDGAAVGPLDRLPRRALGFRSRVRHGHDDRARAVLRHGAHDGLRKEAARLRREAQ